MSMNGELKLLGIPESPFVNRVQIALNLKSLHYEFIVEKNLPIKKSDLLLKSNPVHKKIPVLIHNGRPISESLAIVEYIDEVWTAAGDHSSILPSDPYERANARFWAAYIDLKMLPLIIELIGISTKRDEAAKKVASNKIIEILLLLEDVFVKNNTAFFGGNEIGYLDIALGSVLGWLKLIEITNNVKLFDQVNTPKLVEWATAFLSNDATKHVVPDPEQLIQYSIAFRAKLAAADAASN